MDGSIAVGHVLLGKYRIERVLGRGGMGIVVAARHVDLGKRVAIKMLLPQAMEYPGACERFVREARSAARLEGDHIAQVHDTGTLENGTPYILMEYLDGQDLKKVVRERGALPCGEAARYLIQACEAVAEAHKHGIVHRDLKPANMMLVRRANGVPCVKVLDFGISKNQDPAARAHDLTQSGVIMCSPSYMAPEQVSHPKEVDPRSDIWALGVVLYELVTGILPFYADSGIELLAQVLQKQPRRPVDLVAGLSRELDGVILRCLDKDRDKRFQTVADLAAALQPFIALELVPEPSRNRPSAEMDMPSSEWSDVTGKTLSETSTRPLPGKGVGATLKLDTMDETRTRMLPKTFEGKTVQFPETAEVETQTTVIADKLQQDPGPITDPITAPVTEPITEPITEEEWQLPMQQRRAGVAMAVILMLALVLLAIAQIMPMKNDKRVAAEPNTPQVTTKAPTAIPDHPAAPATVHDETKIIDKPTHSSALIVPPPDGPIAQRTAPTASISASAAPASVKASRPNNSAMTPDIRTPTTQPAEAEIYTTTSMRQSMGLEGQTTGVAPTATPTTKRIVIFDDGQP